MINHREKTLGKRELLQMHKNKSISLHYLLQHLDFSGVFFYDLLLIGWGFNVDLNFLVAQHFMRQIVEGMLYLHSHGILHRDLTLANLLLTRNMNVVSSPFLI